jgi:hypothetical protein
MSIQAKVNTPRSVVGSVSQGNQPQVTRVNVSLNNVSAADDVDVTSFPLTDGAVLQWNESTKKWTARNELGTTGGTLKLSGGSF